MPVIPTLPPGQVRGTGLPTVRVTADAFGARDAEIKAQNAASLGNIGQSLARVGVSGVIAEQQQSEERADLADRIAARNAYTQFRGGLQSTYYNEVLGKKGLDARQAPDLFNDRANKSMQDLIKGLTPRQQQYFQASAASVLTTYEGRIDSHVTKELEEANKNSLLAENSLAATDAIRDGSPQMLATAEADIAANLSALYRGQDPRFIQFKKSEAINKLYADRVTAILATDPKKADAELELYKDKLDPKWYSQTREKVTQSLVQKLDEETADQEYYAGLQAGKTRDEILEGIQKKYKGNSARGNNVAKLVNEKWAATEAARKRDQEVRIESEWDKLFGNPAYKVPFDLDPATRSVMLDWQTEATKPADKQAITNPVVRKQLSSLTPQQFANVDLMQYGESLSPSDFKDMIQRQREVRQGKTGQSDRTRSIYNQVDERIKGLSMFDQSTATRSPWQRNENATRLSRFYGQFDQRLKELPEEERTDAKVSEIVSSLLRPVQKGGLFSSRRYAFEVPYDSGIQDKAPAPLEGKGATWDATRDVWIVPKGTDRRGIYNRDGVLLENEVFQKEPSSSSAKPSGAAGEPLSQNAAVDEKLVRFVKDQEGFKARAYSDYGQYSVGYGTRAKSANETIDQAEADARLSEELNSSKERILSAAKEVSLPLSEDQVVALTSFDFNTGRGPDLIRTSTSLGEIKRRMLRYTKADGKELAGLVKRRQAETELLGEI